MKKIGVELVLSIAKKDSSRKRKSELIYNSGSPFERLQMDILGPFSISFLGDKYLLVILD